MPMQLHDTMSRRLVDVDPIEAGHIRLYTCGPTVYSRAHIGNFRAYVFEDVLRRWLERRFERVTHVMNLTDVEDKIIRNAVAKGHGLREETAPWIDAFFEDVAALNIRPAHHYPRATEYIGQIVDLIDRLTVRGLTYESDGSIYFKIAAFPGYGRLSGARSQDLVTGGGGRIDADEYDKEDARDFALWKAVGPGEIGWDTRLGRGRPGWHIECSAMSMALLGESFDIHCGGVDNIFPHHENEIAQSEGATGKPFVRIWCHNGHLRADSEKMSKSLGNVVTVRQIVDAGTPASAVRYTLAATANYGKPMNYGVEAAEASVAAVDRLFTFRERVRAVQTGEAPDSELVARVDEAWQAFGAALDDNLNLSAGMGVVFDVVRAVNRVLDGGVTITGDERGRVLTFIDDVDDVLGVLELADRERSAAAGADVQSLLDERAGARAARDFRRADALRDQLAEAGIAVEDTPQGQRWKRLAGG